MVERFVTKWNSWTRWRHTWIISETDPVTFEGHDQHICGSYDGENMDIPGATVTPDQVVYVLLQTGSRICMALNNNGP
jgi:hypothetical protein